MSKSSRLLTRKRRRQLKAALKHGPAAKPTHQGKSGRTGSMHAKKLGTRRTP